MQLAVISESEVRNLLTQVDCIELMASAFEDLARGRAEQPLRGIIPLYKAADDTSPAADKVGKGVMGIMPAQIRGAIDTHGIKVVNIFPENHGTGFDAHQGVVVLFEPVHGCPVAVLEGSSITAIRTGAVSALATRILARPEASTLGLLGSGVQAETHLDAIRRVRPIERVVVWSRNAENARRFVTRQGSRSRESDMPAIPIEVVATPREAVIGCSIVCTLTGAGEPLLAGEWLEEGSHVNVVGACLPDRREVDTTAVQRSRLFADRIESLENEAGDYLIPLREGAIERSHVVGELGSVLVGDVEGRRSPQEITMFKSLGLGIEDLVAGWHVYRAAAKNGSGTSVDFGGTIHEGD